MMKNLFFLFSFFPFIVFSQNLSEPDISVASGFYEEMVEVAISHPNSSIRILYTLDGSEPKIENLQGKEWHYKTYYPVYPGDAFGELLQDTMWTYEYHQPIVLENRTPVETVLSDVYTTVIAQGVHAEGELFKGNILRVRAYSEATDQYSETVSRNYFVVPEGNERYTVPVLAIAVDQDQFYDYNQGIGVPGALFDNWRQDNPEAPMDGFAPANYQGRGSETEKRIHFNYFENGEEILNHDAGLRINGGYTRSSPNKSLRLYAKSGYGTKSFKHHFFQDYDVNKFKRLVLRNSGNDGVASFFRDAFIHKLTKNLNFDVQESQPVALFINGEYNGLRNIRERYDKKYFEQIHGIPEEDLDFLENHVEVKEGDDVFYNEMKSFFENNSLSDDAVYEQALTYLDPINFTDYYIAYIYAANDDWPGNNYLFFRHRIPYDPNGAQGVRDGRFRWILKDMDRGFFLHQRSENGYDANTLAWATQATETTLLMRRLLDNVPYRIYFINRFADLLNTTFQEDRVLALIEDFGALYAPEIDENGRRWKGFSAMPPAWQDDVDRMKSFAFYRPEYQRVHIVEEFNLEGVFDFVLNVSGNGHGYIHLNTIDILPETEGVSDYGYPWIGKYFKSVPVTLTAIPMEGYEFSHWSGASNSEEPEIRLTLYDDSYIKANFMPKSVGVTPEISEKIVIYPNPTEDVVYIQGSRDWKDYVLYDMRGRTVKSGLLDGDRINVDQLATGVYVLELTSKEDVKKQVRLIKK